MSTFTGTPSRRNIRTSVDLIGQLINIYRNPGETLASFKERILDNYINPGGVTYDGLYNGIARELGLDAQTRGIIIDIARDTDGTPLNSTAGLEITSKSLNLYSDHVAGTIQNSIDLNDREGSFFISDLINSINNTSGWEAVSMGGLDDYARSTNLEHLSSRKSIRAYQLLASKANNLSTLLESGNYLLSNSILFSSSDRITKETLSMPTSDNEFMVDYNNNVVFTKIIPLGTISFQYEVLPLFIRWSDVSINSFLDDEFIALITEQVLNEDQELVDGIPTQKGSEYINELLSIHRQTWGS